MNIDNSKNMVILKDLPSNIVEEAIVILKPNVKIKSKDLIDKKSSKNNKNKKTSNSKKYIINEAEMIVNNYISKIENDKKNNIKEKTKIENKYKRLRALCIFLGILFIASVII